MKPPYLARWLALSFAAMGPLVAFACASDPGLGGSNPPPDGSAGSGASGGAAGTSGNGGSGAGFQGADLGAPCSDDADCKSQQCTTVGQSDGKKVCTQPCVEGSSCPAGTYCANTGGDGYACVPDNGNQCAVCTDSASCPNVADQCVTGPKGDRFCARDCSFDGACPSGMECVAPETYGSGSGVDAGAGPADGGKPARICVPAGGDSCPCNSAREGATRLCRNTVGGVTCEGTETCNGGSGAWENCSATTPSAEVCDGADNDCNGTKDDGDDNALCAGQGTPENATWSCDRAAGTCLPQCTAGFTRFPATLPPEAGCPCPLDEPASDDLCTAPTNAGAIAESSGTPLTLTGRLTSSTDVDWYRFETVDDGPTEGSNAYHVKIRFTQNPGDEFTFDVIRGAGCAEPDTAHSGLSEYTWCVDGTGTATRGQGTCGSQAAVRCGPESAPYLVRVRRKAADGGTCARYTLEVWARKPGDAPACDFSSATGQCDPHKN